MRLFAWDEASRSRHYSALSIVESVCASAASFGVAYYWSYWLHILVASTMGQVHALAPNDAAERRHWFTRVPRRDVMRNRSPAHAPWWTGAGMVEVNALVVPVCSGPVRPVIFILFYWREVPPSRRDRKATLAMPYFGWTCP